MAFNAYIKIGDIEGGSQDKGHRGEIDVLSFSWGVASAGRRRRPRVEDFTIVKYVDKASPLLLEGICEGQVYKSAVFTAESVGDQSQALFKFFFDDVMLTGLNPAGQAGDATPVESVSLNFTRVEYEVYDQRGGGVRRGSCEQPSQGRLGAAEPEEPEQPAQR